ncbi:MAG: hypothetical protein ACTHJR_03575 [Sphingomonas sp.]|uniref:hypothetical protein n=1 Tax=Sphingomonas sp. TaxID=28214 RepID=UPI003F7FCBA8
MTHEPPVPPDNQSPYPIAEPPHEHPAPLPPVIPSAERADPPRALLIGGAIAAAGLAAIGGLAAVLLRRRSGRSSPAKRGRKR